MSKSKGLLDLFNGGIKEDYKPEDDKDLVQLNEPDEDDFSDLNTDVDDVKKEDESEPDEFTKSVMAVMKHADAPDEEFDPVELARGTEVEKEHFDNVFLAKAVAKAHLKEFPTYYEALAKMEDELKASNSE